MMMYDLKDKMVIDRAKYDGFHKPTPYRGKLKCIY